MRQQMNRGVTVKKRLLLTGIFLFVLLLLTSTGNADTVRTARELRKAGDYQQAIELLNKELGANPTNAQAHIELGACYIGLGKLSLAEAGFARAMNLSPLHAGEIADVYMKAGLAGIEKGRAEEAVQLLEKAVSYRSELKGPLARGLMDKGKAFIQKGQYDEAETRFRAVITVETGHKSEICGIFTKLGDAADDKNCVGLYSRAWTYCGPNDGIGNRLLGIAKKIARRPEADKETAWCKEVASRFLGEDILKAKLPDVVFYEPGIYYFPIKAGEQTDHWILFPRGENVRCKLVANSAGSRYKRVYDNGAVFSPDEKSDAVDGKFKIVAENDCVIKMVVR